MVRAMLLLTLLLALPFGGAHGQLAPSGPSGYAQELQDFGIAPQATLHVGAPHAPTPLSTPGATMITTTDLYARLMARQPLVLLYVNSAKDGMAIAGSHWLDGAGLGDSFDDGVQVRLGRKVQELTSGNLYAPVVVFCFDAHCWLSYNAALRLARLGYRHVYWYRGGREGWKAAGLPVSALPREGW